MGWLGAVLAKQGNALVAILAEVDATADVGYYIIIKGLSYNL